MAGVAWGRSTAWLFPKGWHRARTPMDCRPSYTMAGTPSAKACVAKGSSIGARQEHRCRDLCFQQGGTASKTSVLRFAIIMRGQGLPAERTL